MADDGDELDPQQAEDLAALIGEAMREALRSEDPAAVEAAVRRLLPEMAPRMVAAAPNPASLRSIESCLARGIWNAAPLPSNGYRARPLPEPDRNELCPCGSGTKYKRCCALLVHSFPAIDPDAAWQALGARLPVKEAGTLLESSVLPPEALAPLAQRALEHRSPRKVYQQLDRRLTAAPRLDSRHEDAVLLAIDLDADLHGTDDALERALAVVRATSADLGGPVLRHLVPLALDAGEEDVARELFKKAREAQPDHPDLALLEVSIALATGDVEHARDRAAFWLAWLRRRGLAEDMAEVVELLETAVRDPEGARAALHEGPEAALEIPPFLETLAEVVAEAADRPIHPYGLVEGAAGVVFASPPAAAAKAEAAWSRAWPGRKPDLVSLEIAFERDLVEESSRWLGALRRHPPAFDSLSVLDDLVLLAAPVAEGPFPALAATLLEPLLRRSLALIRRSLVDHEGRRLEWAHHENRPALRLLTQEARRLDRAGRAGDAATLYAWMMRLNPNDNHGHREWMINHHLRSGADEAALAVAAGYPDDILVATMFGRALALWRLGRREEAEVCLRAAAADRRRVVRALLADEMACPESDPYGPVVGGEEEAWLYREEMRPTWQASPDVLAFLRSLPPPAGRSSRRRRKAGSL